MSDEKDPERLYYFHECCDLLVAAGYFRARLTSLSPFDRVVGGLVWCITASGFDIDIDIIFKENSNIGEKIKLSDQIIRCLIQMKSDRVLQPQQIQGLDYQHLYAVCRWLVRHVIEHRRLTGDITKQSALHSFKQFFTLPPSSDASDFITPPPAAQPPSSPPKPPTPINLTGFSTIDSKYKYSRIFKVKEGARFDSAQSRVEATLLEYGEKFYGGRVAEKAEEKKEEKKGTVAALKSKIAKDLDPSAADKQDDGDDTEARLAALQSQLQSISSSSRLTGENVVDLLGNESEEIRRRREEFDAEREKEEKEKERDGMDGAFQGRRGAEMAFNRQFEGLKKKIQLERDALQQRSSRLDELKKKEESAQLRKEEVQSQIDRLANEMKKFNEIESNEQTRSVLEALRSLVSLNENLKQQEAQFKSSCLAQRDSILSEIKKLESFEQNEENQKIVEIEGIWESDNNKLAKIRHLLAMKNQEISKIQRAIDEIPTRAELLQFERRFVELYELIAAKLAETKKYYNLYNTLNDSLTFMQSEQGLFNSIVNNFQSMGRTKTGGIANGEAFLESIERALQKVKEQKVELTEQLGQLNSKKEKYVESFNGLVDKQRAYFKAVKEFQEECDKNEKLVAMAEEAAGGGGGGGGE